MTKTEILKKVRDCVKTTAVNRMGCSEDWYNPFYAMKEVFGIEELEDMSEKELNNLVRLGDGISAALY